MVNRLVSKKAAPEEADTYREWLGAAAQEAANAAKDGGFMGFHAQRVSEGEQRMLDKLAEVLPRPARLPLQAGERVLFASLWASSRVESAVRPIIAANLARRSQPNVCSGQRRGNCERKSGQLKQLRSPETAEYASEVPVGAGCGPGGRSPGACDVSQRLTSGGHRGPARITYATALRSGASAVSIWVARAGCRCRGACGVTPDRSAGPRG
jgi:hypothetical protein